MFHLQLDFVGCVLDGLVCLCLCVIDGSLASVGSIVGSFLACIDGIVHGFLACIDGIVYSLLASINGIVHSALSSIYCVAHSTFNLFLSALDGIFCGTLGGINGSARQSLNLVEDLGERSYVDVEALQCLSILLDERLNLSSVLSNLLNVAGINQLAQLSLNGLESSCDGCCITSLNLLCERIYDSFGSSFLEVEVFCHLVTSAACQTHNSNCCHCK